MQNVHLYLTLFPTESLIASHLNPQAFAIYMATGTKRGSSEPLTFIEITGDTSHFIDPDYLTTELGKLPEGRIKHSLYLSIYRSLEETPLANLGSLYLVTHDGRSLCLEPSDAPEFPADENKFLYQELCPVRPLVVSNLNPVAFCQHMTNPTVKIHLPKIAFVHKRVVDLDQWSESGYYGGHYLASPSHVKSCFQSLDKATGKYTKVIGRSRLQTFNYGLIDSGVYVGDSQTVRFYPMKSREELNNKHYAWAKSAQIL
ncbi:MAG: hypothetical protein JJU29_05665 [Verrucomicrobia bacterium]|nr:hypothetical protein [Verrucomicrobiota bacterium]MCH8511282.1 hypothetical protein [Kiritimatiellia bacterium]